MSDIYIQYNFEIQEITNLDDFIFSSETLAIIGQSVATPWRTVMIWDDRGDPGVYLNSGQTVGLSCTL